jgi:DNA-binding PadR family transcriptional regulator
MKKETLKGHLDLLLLAVVGAGASHGYLIARRLAEASGGPRPSEGTLYPRFTVWIEGPPLLG